MPDHKEIILRELASGDINQDLGGRAIGLLGCALMILIAFLLSNNKKRINWRLVAIGTGIQFAFAFMILKLEVGRLFFEAANNVIIKILSFSIEGSRFLFGNLVTQNIPVGIPTGDSPAFSPLNLNGSWAHTGAIFAFSILPTIIFFSALTAALYHLRILEWVVKGMSYLMHRTMGTSGAETFSAAANIFVGQTEAPLLIKPFLANMTNSEIMAIMTGGMATVAGGVMAAYVGMLMGYFPDIAGHILAASVMSAPASLVMAKIMIPETGIPETLKTSGVKVEHQSANLLDAISRGTSDGLQLMLNVGAMLIAFIALISMVNWIIGGIGDLAGLTGVSLEMIFSSAFAPLAFVLGVPWEDAGNIGNLLGTKTVLNELVAYLELADYLRDGTLTSGKSVIIATYALCGFSNFSSIGIQIGGLSALAPSRRADFAKIGLRAMIAGSLACFQTAAIAGILL